MSKKDISEKALQLYLKEIEQYSDLKLTSEEERELFKKIEQGDERAKRKLFYANLDLVSNIVERYKKKNPNLTEFDLICEGTLALIRAINLFDWKNNYRFPTFASLLIRGAILKSLKEGKTVFKGIVKAPPWPSFHDKSIYIDYFDERSKRWVLEKMREFTKKEKEESQSQIKIDVEENMPEIIELISKITHISKLKVKQELEKIIQKIQ